MRSSVVFALVILLSRVVPAQAQPDFSHAPCGFFVPAGERATCGYLETSGSDDPLSPRLFVAVLHSTSQAPAPDPLLWISGGPGQSAFDDDAAEIWWDLTASFRRRRDVILYDARGVGRSQPSLDCVEFDETGVSGLSGRADPLQDEVEKLLRCRDRLLEEGIDFSDYRLPNHAADIVRFLHVLSLDQVNLVGVSYGTRVALHVMRQVPDRVRTAVLDSAFPPDVNGLVESPAIRADVFELLFDDCRIDFRCRRAFPDLLQRFDAIISWLVAGDVTVLRWSGGGQDEVLVAPGDVIDALILMAGDADAVRDIPVAIWRAGIRDLRPLVPYLLVRAGSGPGFSEGVALSAECSEDWAFADVTDYARNVAAYAPFSSGHAGTLAWLICPNWPVQAVRSALREPVTSDVPTLLLTGSYDPLTPPRWTYHAVRDLRHGQVLELASGSHGVLGRFPCAVTAAATFVDMPGHRVADLCRDRTRPPRFTLD